MANTGMTFTDAQIEEACGLHVDNLRRLITWRAVRPVQAGGGRGRVRLWSLRQALQIAVTAEFFHAGFSLQMAHTLAYCLPIHGLLDLYEAAEDLRDAAGMRHLFDPDKINPTAEIGGDVVILNRKYIYTDLFDDNSFHDDEPTEWYGDCRFCIVAVIADGGTSVMPLLSGVISISNKYYVADGVESMVSGRELDIDRSSLLVDDLDLRVTDNRTNDPVLERQLNSRFDEVVGNAPRMFRDTEYLNYRSSQEIHLSVGLHIAYRKLIGLPVDYHIVEEPHDEEGET